MSRLCEWLSRSARDGLFGLLLVLFVLLPAVGAVAADAPLAGVGPHSTKKGAGVAVRRLADWPQRVAALNVTWYYTWREYYPGDVPGRPEFVPMLWGSNSVTEANLAELVRGARERRYRHLLGFNEPDIARQAAIPVEEALRLWPSLAATGLRLGSPAAVNAGNQWIRTFVAGVEKSGGRIDFIALHWYGPDPGRFLRHLDNVYRRYGRPIWITEFAVADWRARETGVSRYSPQDAYRFMQAVIPALEQLPYVERYAWYSPPDSDHPALSQSALFESNGALTALGRLYAAY